MVNDGNWNVGGSEVSQGECMFGDGSVRTAEGKLTPQIKAIISGSSWTCSSVQKQ